MVKHMPIAKCVLCRDGKHDQCRGTTKRKHRVKLGRDWWTTEVVYTHCECEGRGHAPETKGVLKR
jgi:hypothetical protein